MNHSDMYCHARRLNTQGGASDVGDSIVDYAQRQHAAMVAVGSRGMGATRAAIMGLIGLGSVSKYLVHHAACPVLVVVGDGTLPNVAATRAASEAAEAAEAAAGVEVPAEMVEAATAADAAEAAAAAAAAEVDVPAEAVEAAAGAALIEVGVEAEAEAAGAEFSGKAAEALLAGAEVPSNM